MMTIASSAFESCDVHSFEGEEEVEEQYHEDTGRPTHISPQLIYQTSTSSSNNNMMENYYGTTPAIQGCLPGLEVEEEIIESDQEDYETEAEDEVEELLYSNPVQVLRARRQKLERTNKDSSSPVILATIPEAGSSELNADDPIEEAYLEDPIPISFETSSESTSICKKRKHPITIQDKLETHSISLKDRYYKPLLSSPLARFYYDSSSFIKEIHEVIVMNLVDDIEVGGIEDDMESFINYSESEAGEDDSDVEEKSDLSPSPTISERYRMWSERDFDQVVKEEQEKEEPRIRTMLDITMDIKAEIQVKVEESISLNASSRVDEEETDESISFPTFSTFSNKRSKYPSIRRASTTFLQIKPKNRSRALRADMESESESEMRDPWCEM